MGRKRATGYATKKALEVIAWEQGLGPEPKLPRSRSLRGSIRAQVARFKTERPEAEIEPKGAVQKAIYRKTIKRLGLVKRPRLFFRLYNRYYSAERGATPKELLKRVYRAQGESFSGAPKGSPTLIIEGGEYGTADEIANAINKVILKMTDRTSAERTNRLLAKEELDAEFFYKSNIGRGARRGGKGAPRR